VLILAAAWRSGCGNVRRRYATLGACVVAKLAAALLKHRRAFSFAIAWRLQACGVTPSLPACMENRVGDWTGGSHEQAVDGRWQGGDG